jgi:glutamine amidotransferase
MCRWIAYRGKPIALENYITAPVHSLIEQSRRAQESQDSLNGDGFGLGWYGERREPGVYREIRPAWSDENLRHLSRHIRSHLFFGHVRASTGTQITRPNCHPFAYDRWLFMHNGQVGDWSLIRRKVEELIPDTYYNARLGTTDSEAVFLAILGAGADRDVIGATSRTLTAIGEIARASGSREPVRFTAALSDGKRMFAFRFATDDTATSLYYSETGDHLVVVSEPLDQDRSHWKPVPAGHYIIAGDGPVALLPFPYDARLAAAE